MNLNITGSYMPYSYGTNSGNAKALKDRSGSQPESRHIGTTDRDFSDRIRIQKEQYYAICSCWMC